MNIQDQRTQRQEAAQSNFRAGLLDQLQDAEANLARYQVARDRCDGVLAAGLPRALELVANLNAKIEAHDNNAKKAARKKPNTKIAKSAYDAADKFEKALSALVHSIANVQIAAHAVYENGAIGW